MKSADEQFIDVGFRPCDPDPGCVAAFRNSDGETINFDKNRRRCWTSRFMKITPSIKSAIFNKYLELGWIK